MRVGVHHDLRAVRALAGGADQALSEAARGEEAGGGDGEIVSAKLRLILLPSDHFRTTRNGDSTPETAKAANRSRIAKARRYH